MTKRVILSTFLFIHAYTYSQVGINTQNPKTTLHIVPTQTNGTTAEGIIAPNLTRAQLIAKDSKYTADERGAIVYVSAIDGTVSTKTSNVTASGYYYFDGSVWQSFKPEVAAQPWNKVGSSAPSTANTDNSYLKAKVVIGGTIPASINGGSQNAQLTVAGGDASVNGITVGRGANNTRDNVVVGERALTNPSANYSVAFGNRALTVNKGQYALALGNDALSQASDAAYSIAVGHTAMNGLTSGQGNIALGYGAFSNLYTGSYNLGIGYNVRAPRPTGSNQMNIGNTIFGTTGISDGAPGSVSIGKTTPTTGAKLDVNGLTILNSLRYVNGTQGSGKFLMSDASGNATWTEIQKNNNVEIYGGQAFIPPHNAGATGGGVPDWSNHSNSSYDTSDWIIISKQSYNTQFTQGTYAPYAVTNIRPASMVLVYEYKGDPFDLANLYPILTAGNNSQYRDSFTPVFMKLENVTNKTRLTVQVVRVDNFGIGIYDQDSNWAGSFFLNILLAKKI